MFVQLFHFCHQTFIYFFKLILSLEKYKNMYRFFKFYSHIFNHFLSVFLSMIIRIINLTLLIAKVLLSRIKKKFLVNIFKHP